MDLPGLPSPSRRTTLRVPVNKDTIRNSISQLRSNSDLTELNFEVDKSSSATLTSKQAKYIAEALTENTTLQSLNIKGKRVAFHISKKFFLI